jgi:HSP20 family protein
MHTIIQTTKPTRRHRSAESAPEVQFRKPMYDCQDESAALKLTVYVPGVEAAGVSIEARGPDLIVTARKTHFVRVNWQALHLESAQRDYRLRLRLGRDFRFETMQAEIHQGVLAVTLPKRSGQTAGAARLRRVA